MERMIGIGFIVLACVACAAAPPLDVPVEFVMSAGCELPPLQRGAWPACRMVVVDGKKGCFFDGRSSAQLAARLSAYRVWVRSVRARCGRAPDGGLGSTEDVAPDGDDGQVDLDLGRGGGE